MLKVKTGYFIISCFTFLRGGRRLYYSNFFKICLIQLFDMA